MMFRKFSILFCVILCSTEIFGTFELIRNILETKDWNVTRVRTVAERDARSEEFVVLDFVSIKKVTIINSITKYYKQILLASFSNKY